MKCWKSADRRPSEQHETLSPAPKTGVGGGERYEEVGRGRETVGRCAETVGRPCEDLMKRYGEGAERVWRVQFFWGAQGGILRAGRTRRAGRASEAGQGKGKVTGKGRGQEQGQGRARLGKGRRGRADVKSGMTSGSSFKQDVYDRRLGPR